MRGKTTDVTFNWLGLEVTATIYVNPPTDTYQGLREVQGFGPIMLGSNEIPDELLFRLVVDYDKELAEKALDVYGGRL